MQTTDPYADDAPWAAELRALQRILLDCGLEETQKWRARCFMDQERNIALLGPQKDAAILSFIKGVILPDPDGLLESAGPNSHAVRLVRLHGLDEIAEREGAIRALIAAAVDAERSGKPVPKRPGGLELCDEIEEALEADADLRRAWDGLTPGRQRGYQIHVAGAKQSATRAERFERCYDRILMGKGLRDCICGHSKRMPNCDGSHKHYS